MSEPKVRELRVTDIRCRACDAAPAARCRDVHEGNVHLARAAEHATLVNDGWEWQEVDPRDAGARKE